MKCMSNFWFRFVMSLLSACAVSVLTALWAIPAAAAERGVSGQVGGEWLLILAAGVLVFRLTMPWRDAR